MRFCLKGIQGWTRTAVALAMIFGLATTIEVTQPAAYGQNSTTGSINGTVVDATGAVVPNASVTVKDTVTGAIQNLTTNADGRFIVPFLKPDKFNVSATAPGMQSATTSVQILVGQQATVNVSMSPTASSQTVMVNASNAQLIDTQTSNTTTTFTTQQFQNLPMPGGDITSIAYTVPGVVVNAGTGFGYGNFSSDGLPGISNLVVIDGADDNDPFLNLNNTGSSNLTLGQEEIAQASVVQNGYSVEYGRQAGVIENYVTKSGENRVHGLLQYNYNSAGLNANDFFNNLNGVPKSKAVSNQYAAQIGGPILRNKLFFFADTEGIRYITPVSNYVNFPNAQLQNTILNTLPGGPNGSSAALYGTMFNLLKTAPSYATATPVTTGPGALQDSSGALGCGSIAGTPVYGTANEYFGTVPSSAPAGSTAISCMNSAFATSTNLNKEYLIAGRVDWQINERHRAFVRITDDQGQQPTFTSAINPLLNAQSIQPAYSGQLNDTYTLTPNLTNQFIVTGLWYSAIFNAANDAATLKVSPTLFYEPFDAGTNSFAGIGQTSSYGAVFGFEWFGYPQGRNVTQWQIVDDASWLKGNHDFKFGGNFKRDDVTDVGNQTNTISGYYLFGGAADFAGGTLPGSIGSNYNVSFTTVPAAHSALYNLGVYAQDEWKAKPNLVVDYGVRVDRNGNPACTTNCFSHYAGGFPQAGVTLDTPYNSTISIGHRSAFYSVEKAIIQPRVGFNWDTKGDGHTVLRGGVGLFADQFPAFIIGSEYGTFPNNFSPSVSSGTVGTGAGSAPAAAQASNAAFNSGFSQGAGANQLASSLPAGVAFAEPTYYTTSNDFKSPKYLEWSLQLQRQLNSSNAIIVSYAGNHGYDLLIQNNHVNQNLGGTTLADGQTVFNPSGYTSFGGLPTNSPDPRFGEVTKVTNEAISNYNGVSATFKHIDRRGLTADVSYTYSHALDDISNGGTGLNFNGTAITSQITPYSASELMYSNADYDIRHNLVLDVTYAEQNHFANKLVDLAAGGWTVAAKAYWRTGEPFSVTNSNAQNNLNNGTSNNPPTVLADVLNNHFNHTCNSFTQHCFQTPGIFDGSATQDNFGNVPRNAFYGPHYADVDLSVYKALIHWNTMQFQVGTQVYNILNHVNFGAPGNNASNPATLGVISTDVIAPTSPYGSFQGSAVSGRVLVVQGRLTF